MHGGAHTGVILHQKKHQGRWNFKWLTKGSSVCGDCCSDGKGEECGPVLLPVV